MKNMRHIIFAAFCGMASINLALAAEKMVDIVRDPEQTREQIERLYRLEQAFLVCDQVRLTGHDLKRLDSAIAEFEHASGLAVEELESIYGQIEASVSASPSQFCSDMVDVADNIRAFPASAKY